MLYLLKSAITNEYLQENLRALAAPLGERVTVGYAAQWVHPALWGQLKPGDVACLVFGDRPYERFVPIRRSEVVDVTDKRGETRLTLMLGSFAEETDIGAFSRAFSLQYRGGRFVSEGPDEWVTFVTEEQDDQRAWTRIVEALAMPADDGRPSRYSRSVFLRQMSLRSTLRDHIPSDRQLEIGKTYLQPLYSYAPGLGQKELRDYALVVEPSSHNVEIGAPPRLLPDGELVFEISPVEAGEIRLDLWVKPDRARSTALTLQYAVIEPPVSLDAVEAVTPVAQTTLSDRDLREVFDVIRMPDDATRDEALLGLVDHVLKPFARQSHFLMEQRGLCLYRLGRWDKAYQALSELDPDLLSPTAVVASFVSACRGGIDANFTSILSRFTAWDNSRLVEELIHALPVVVADTKLVSLMQILCRYTTTHQQRVWQAIHDRLSDPASILKAVGALVDREQIGLLSPAEAYSYLVARMTTLGLDNLELLERAVELGLQAQDLVEGLGDRFLTLVERRLALGQDLTDLWALTEENRARVGGHTWAEAMELLADAMLAQDDENWRDQACHLYTELARFYRENDGDLETAWRCLERASSMLPSANEPAASALEHEQAQWLQAVQRLETMRQWWEGLIEVKQQRLRQLMKGKRVLLIGGMKRQFDEEEIRRELGLAEVSFVPHFSSERGSLEKVRRRIRQGNVDYVVDFIRRGGHRHLQDDCKSAGVHYVPVLRGWGLNQLVLALAKEHAIELQ